MPKQAGIINKVKRVHKEIEEIVFQLSNSEQRILSSMFKSINNRLEAIMTVHGEDLLDVKTGMTPQDRQYEISFIAAWEKQFPKYGKLTSLDYPSLRSLINSLIKTVYPTADEKFFAGVIKNFADSDQQWVIDNRTVKTFCNNFRKFIDRPLIDRNKTTIISL